MSIELKATVVNMKSLSQNIEDPIVNGAADVKGRTLRVIFTQEAAAQITPKTKVYLAWYHQNKDIRGYNAFSQIINVDDEDFPPTWEIYYPSSMLWEGNVLANIQLVDNVSIAVSTNFIIHILKDFNEEEDQDPISDYSEFKKAAIALSSLSEQMEEQLIYNEENFNRIVEEFERMKDTIATEDSVEEIRQILENTVTIVEENQSQISEVDNDIETLWNQHIVDLTFHEFL